MRAIVECDRVLTEFADQTEACADVLLIKGWAYRDLGDDQASRDCFTLLAKSYPSVEWATEAATAALETLDGEP